MSDAGHNFEWALEQMRAGKRVWRPRIIHRFLRIYDGDLRVCYKNGQSHYVYGEDILATDWELYKGD